MAYLPRHLESTIARIAARYPVILLTGSLADGQDHAARASGARGPRVCQLLEIDGALDRAVSVGVCARRSDRPTVELLTGDPAVASTEFYFDGIPVWTELQPGTPGWLTVQGPGEDELVLDTGGARFGPGANRTTLEHFRPRRITVGSDRASPVRIQVPASGLR